VPARGKSGRARLRGLAGVGGCLAPFRAAVPLRLALAVAARLARAGPGVFGRFARAGGEDGDPGLDIRQRVIGVRGEPGQVAGGSGTP
jgi:hypothetical protein